ncbi:Cytosolic seryl-tRNA synthetase [Xylographa vitiligo]|nr:Cytosolic seryl-tRNA synthetase [Xylographa vitiligo]
MLDILDFQEDKGGDLKKLRESQRRRYAPEAIVDDVVALFEDMKKTRYAATQIGTQINATQKEIGAKKKVRIVAAILGLV